MDLYSLLGVPRNASDDAIARAYRRLARRYHPGVNPGDSVAETMYRQVQQAYEILADLERRREYDRGVIAIDLVAPETTVAFAGFDFSQPAEGPLAATFSELFAEVFHEAAREATTPTQGASVDLTARVPFETAIRGGDLPLSVTRQERCPSCAGDGRTARPPATCPACGGEGQRRWARGHMQFTKTCEECTGVGRVTSQSCRPCGGTGVQPRSEVVTVSLPPGVDAGARVVVPGRGHAGAMGGPAGDLYVTLDVAPHPFFQREGADLRVALPVAIHEAALGARVDAPTLDGAVKVKVPAGVVAGQTLRVPGHGVPDPQGGAGDLICEVVIVLPPVRDERSRELLREFGRLNAGDVRRHLFAERN